MFWLSNYLIKQCPRLLKNLKAWVLHKYLDRLLYRSRTLSWDLNIEWNQQRGLNNSIGIIEVFLYKHQTHKSLQKLCFTLLSKNGSRMSCVVLECLEQGAMERMRNKKSNRALSPNRIKSLSCMLTLILGLVYDCVKMLVPMD